MAKTRCLSETFSTIFTFSRDEGSDPLLLYLRLNWSEFISHLWKCFISFGFREWSRQTDRHVTEHLGKLVTRLTHTGTKMMSHFLNKVQVTHVTVTNVDLEMNRELCLETHIWKKKQKDSDLLWFSACWPGGPAAVCLSVWSVHLGFVEFGLVLEISQRVEKNRTDFHFNLLNNDIKLHKMCYIYIHIYSIGDVFIIIKIYKHEV